MCAWIRSEDLQFAWPEIFKFEFGFRNTFLDFIFPRRPTDRPTDQPTNRPTNQTMASDAEVDQSVLRRYVLEKEIGKGSYGVVYKAKHRATGEVIALKKHFDAFRNTTDAKRTFREISYLRQLHHENIVSLISIQLSPDGKDLYSSFSLMETDLSSVVKTTPSILQPAHIQFIVYQMFKALKYIHSASLLHRDLKPSNILIDSSCRIKLCDFGLVRSIADAEAAHQQGRRLTDYVATRWYRAPEILLGSTRYTQSIDVWAVGVIAAEMIRGKSLFPGGSTMNTIERILEYTGRPSPEAIKSTKSPFAETMINDGLPASAGSSPRVSLSSLCKGTGAPKEALDLIRGCLQFNLEKRPTAEDLLRHAYVKDFHDKKKEPAYPTASIQIAINDDLKLSPGDYRNALEQQIETEQRLEALKTARDKARRRGSLAAATAEPALVDEMSRMDVRS